MGVRRSSTNARIQITHNRLIETVRTYFGLGFSVKYKLNASVIHV